jgi:fermentation-respiration switch protein FrsA (DUF1100 family)
VPVLIASPTADPTVHPHFGQEMFDLATSAPCRDLVELTGANHYFSGQPELLEFALDSIATWIRTNVGI